MKRLIFIFVMLATSCSGIPANVSTPVRSALEQMPAFRETTSSTSTAFLAPIDTSTPTLSPTPDLYYVYTNEYLRSRLYGGGKIEFLEVMEKNIFFSRYSIRYFSDGLSVYGFANIPNDGGPHPVIVALHGYIDPASYDTLDYTTHYADALANAGYIVLHPNLRGYPPSEGGENLFRVGMAIDVLNLIEILKTQSGQSDTPLQTANPNQIGLWGHSMGGGISTRVLTVSKDVRAAVLYGAMSGDEQKNYEAIRQWSGNTRGLEERFIPTEAVSRISSMYFFDHVTAAVSIHHGTADALVPLEWSMRTCEQLKSLGKNVECIYYENMPHTFYGAGDEEFLQNTIQFFNRVLTAP